MPPGLLLTKISGCGWRELNSPTRPSALPHNPQPSLFIHKQNQFLQNISTFLSHFHLSRIIQFKSLANIPIGNQRDNYGVLISRQILKFCVGFCQLFCWKYSIGSSIKPKDHSSSKPVKKINKKFRVHLIYYFLCLSSIFILGIQWQVWNFVCECTLTELLLYAREWPSKPFTLTESF